MAIVENYSVDKLVSFGLGDNRYGYPEIALNTNEKIRGIKLIDIFSKIATVKTGPSKQIFCNKDESPDLYIRFPILGSAYPKQGVVSDYIYAVGLNTTYYELLYNRNNVPNFAILLNTHNVFEPEHGDFDRDANDWNRNVIPYFDANTNSMYLHITESLDTQKKQFIKDTINKYINEGQYFIVEGVRNKSFIVKGAASFIDVLEIKVSTSERPTAVNIFANYTDSGSTYDLGTYNINYISVAPVYTGNKTTT